VTEYIRVFGMVFAPKRSKDGRKNYETESEGGSVTASDVAEPSVFFAVRGRITLSSCIKHKAEQ